MLQLVILNFKWKRHEKSFQILIFILRKMAQITRGGKFAGKCFSPLLQLRCDNLFRASDAYLNSRFHDSQNLGIVLE